VKAKVIISRLITWCAGKGNYLKIDYLVCRKGNYLLTDYLL